MKALFVLLVNASPFSVPVYSFLGGFLLLKKRGRDKEREKQKDGESASLGTSPNQPGYS
jgi:hypothetical protein